MRFRQNTRALLFLAQTAVTLIVTFFIGVEYPEKGMVTSFFLAEFGISVFLITYASDMMSLWVSSLAHNTTTAMTIMPFVLIFQLVFSGGMMTLPAWTEPLTYFTISNPGLKAIAAQADINNRPYATISGMIDKMRDNEIGGTVTVGQVLDLMQDTDNETIASLRAREAGRAIRLSELRDALEQSATFDDLKQETILEGVTVEELLSMADAYGLTDRYGELEVGGRITVGEAVDYLAGNADVQDRRDTAINLKTTVGNLLDIAGEEKVKTFLEEKAAAANYNADYENSAGNIISYWLELILFVFVFAMLATITLEFIDKDKR